MAVQRLEDERRRGGDAEALEAALIATTAAALVADLAVDRARSELEAGKVERARLEELSRELLVAGGTLIQVHGHTDSIGNPEANQLLSEERAFAVRQWLMDKSSVNFPPERISIHAHGPSNPVAPNSTEAGRARNRRVEIILTAN